MCNDRYLEQAAKAVGGSTLDLYKAGKWNPSDNDSTALKLAIILKLDIIMPTDNNLIALCRNKDGTIEGKGITTFTDPFSGVRRAIVMAAAKMYISTTKTTRSTYLRDSINPKTEFSNSYDFRA